MRGAKVPEKLAVSACLLALSCSGNHSVSPWGGGEPPPPSALVQRADLAAQLQVIDAETSALGLSLAVELRGRLPRGEGEVVARGYRGVDRLGRPTSATRVATARAVVLSVGPLSIRDLDRTRATELLPGPPGGEPPPEDGGVRRGPLGDLNGDADPDVVLRSEAGALEVWTLRPFSSVLVERIEPEEPRATTPKEKASETPGGK